MKRNFTIELFHADGSPITKNQQVENLKPGQRVNYLIESSNPLYGYFAKGKTFKNLFVNQKKQLSGFLLVGVPAPDANHVTICEFDRGLINGFEVALTHFNGKTELIVYPAWQGTFNGHPQNIKIGGLTFEPLVKGLSGFIFRNISRIPAKKSEIKFFPYGNKCPKKINGGEVFIQRFKPHTGFGTGLIKVAEKEIKVMLDWKRITDIFAIKEGACLPATIVKLDIPTKLGITHTAIIGATTGEKVVREEARPTKLAEIFDFSKFGMEAKKA